MMRSLKGSTMLWLLGVPLALIATALLYWQLRYPTHTYRYKLTIEIDTPEGVRSGYAVREVTWRDGPRITMEASAGMMEERGEAVTIDLPNGETIFALRPHTQGATVGLAFGTARLKASSSRDPVEVYRPRRYNPVWGQDGYPRFVRFLDLNDPASVEKVDAADLPGVFGRGYAVKRITAKLTDEPITLTVGKRLNWLDDHLNRRIRLNGKRGAIFSNDLADNLSAASFSFNAYGS